MAIPGNVGMRKSTFSSPAAMAQAQRAAEAQSMKALQDRREQTRQDFFKGRQDISDNRLDRRQIQKDLMDQFRDTQMRDVVGATGLKQSVVPGGKTMADRSMELARMYGPTFGEIGGDIRYGLGNLARGFGDFISKGGAIGSVISDIYNRFKGGTQQGIETVKGLYDNLRTTLSGQPTVTYGGGSTMVTTSDGQPRVDLTPTSIATETLPAMNLNRNIGDESDPSIFGITNTGVPLPFLRSTVDNPNLINVLPQDGGYLPEGFSNVGIENPLFRNVNYEPIRVSDMDMTGVMAKEDSRPVLPDNVIPRTPSIYPLPRNVVPMTPVLPQEVTDPRMYQGQVLFAKSGGSVDKYAGLGYKLK